MESAVVNCGDVPDVGRGLNADEFPLAKGVSLCYHKTVGLEVIADGIQAKGDTKQKTDEYGRKRRIFGLAVSPVDFIASWALDCTRIRQLISPTFVFVREPECG